MYLSSIGIALIAAVVWARFFDRLKGQVMARRCYLGISLAVVAVLIAKTISQSFVWKNGVTLWAHQYRYQPDRDKEKIVSGLMTAIAGYMEPELPLEKKDVFIRQISEQAIQQIYPLDEKLSTASKVKILNSTARFYVLRGKKDLAFKYWKEALELDPDYYWAFYRLAFLAMEESRYDDAICLLETAAQRAPVQDRLFQQRVLAAMAEVAVQPQAGGQALQVYNYMKNKHLQWYGP